MAKKFDLNTITYRLLMSEPFFAALSRRIDKKATSAIPTAGVKVNKDTGHFELAYNPEFFASLSEKQMSGVLKHEFYHLIFDHVTGDRINRTTDGKITKLWNIATDLAINSHLKDELPEGALFAGEGPFEHLEAGLSAESYFAALKKDEGEKEEQQGEGGDGGEGGEGGSGEGEQGGDLPDSFDDHSGWGDGDNTSNELAKQRLKEAVKKAAQEASKVGNWGTVSVSVVRIFLIE